MFIKNIRAEEYIFKVFTFILRLQNEHLLQLLSKKTFLKYIPNARHLRSLLGVGQSLAAIFGYSRFCSTITIKIKAISL